MWLILHEKHFTEFLLIACTQQVLALCSQGSLANAWAQSAHTSALGHLVQNTDILFNTYDL
jgi:hypothetical protein